MWGLDISHWNDIPVAEIAKEDVFVILKATQGLTYVDPTFKGSFESLKKEWTIKPIGVYHYFTDKNPENQAEHFFNILKSSGALGKVIPFVDFEEKDNEENYKNLKKGISNVKLFFERFYKLSGNYPAMYLSEYLAKKEDWKILGEKVNLWVAKWFKRDYNPGETTFEKIGNDMFKELYNFGCAKCFYTIVRQFTNVGTYWNCYPLDLNYSFISFFEWNEIADSYKEKPNLPQQNVSHETLLIELEKFVDERIQKYLQENAKEALNKAYGYKDTDSFSKHEDTKHDKAL